MIVCICEGVSDREIRATIEQGATTVGELGARCRAGEDCGRCRAMLRSLLRERPQRPNDRSCGGATR